MTIVLCKSDANKAAFCLLHLLNNLTGYATTRTHTRHAYIRREVGGGEVGDREERRCGMEVGIGRWEVGKWEVGRRGGWREGMWWGESRCGPKLSLTALKKERTKELPPLPLVLVHVLCPPPRRSPEGSSPDAWSDSYRQTHTHTVI